jgi:putative transposase
MKHRKENRLKKKKYHKPGYYYITIRTYYKHCLFGEIINGTMFKNSTGDMVERVIKEIPKFYKGFKVDEFILMPNHIHGIIEIISGDNESQSGKAWEPSRTNTLKEW